MPGRYPRDLLLPRDVGSALKPLLDLRVRPQPIVVKRPHSLLLSIATIDRDDDASYFADLARRLIADGHEVHLYACRQDAAALPPELHCHALPRVRGSRALLHGLERINRRRIPSQPARPGRDLPS